MIITCPSCKRRFELRSKTPATFRCPKCHYQAPFQSILNESPVKNTDSSSDYDVTAMERQSKQKSGINPNQETHVFTGDNLSQQEKTKMVVTCGHLHILNNNSVIKDIPLKLGTPILGRMSTDSQATIKIAPDPYMSRGHARMKIALASDGQIQYIIAPMKQSSPIYLDNNEIPFGKSAILRNGCKIKMGETEMMFVIK